MSGYSKMRQPFQLQKPKSMDSSSDSDLFYFSQPHKNNMKITPNEQEKPSYSEDDDGGDRKIDDDTQIKSSGGSFSMNSTRGFKLSRESSGRSERLSSAVKKVLPMRRSSSVSEGYCRIIYDEFLEVHDEEGYVETETTTTSKNKMKKMGNGVRILKACKRIFGL